MKKKRSVGVTVFAYLNIATGILGIFAFISGIKIIMLGAPLLIIIGVGLLKLREWARKLEILTTILSYFFRWIVVFVISKDLLTSIRYMFQFKQVISLLAVVIIIYFFTRPKVKEQFE